jgi:hypothetical protein
VNSYLSAVIQRTTATKLKGPRKLGAALQSHLKRLKGFFYAKFYIGGGTEQNNKRG